MVRRALRSTSLRNVKRVSPSGKLVIHYERGRPSQASCANCSQALHGVPRLRPARIGKLSKSKHRPNRPYGGNLCPACTKEEIKRKVLKY